MSNNVDTKFNFLRSQGYVGDSQEMELSFYMDNGATVRSLPEAEMQFLINAGYTQGATNDRWYAYLESLGYSGSVDDMLYEAWADGVLGGVVVTNLILLESGDAILLENNDRLRKE